MTLKLAEELLDRFFREAEGEAGRKIDLVFALEHMNLSYEKAEPALEYLNSRGLIAPYTGDAAYLTDRGVDAISKEQDIKVMPKYQPEWGGGAASGVRDAPSTAVGPPAPATAGASLPRPWRPTISYVDPEGKQHSLELGWSGVIGRSDEASIKIPDPRASKKHIELKYAGDRYVLRDLGSANGTMVNGAYVDVHPLRHGDLILVGRTEILYTCPEVIAEPAGEPEPGTVRPAPVAQSTIKPATPPPSKPQTPPKPIAVPPMAAPEPSARRAETPVAPSLRNEPPPPVAPSMRNEPGPVAPSMRGRTPAPQPVRIVKGQPEMAPRPRTPDKDLFAMQPEQEDDGRTDLYDKDKARRAEEDLFGPPLGVKATIDDGGDDLFDEDTPQRATARDNDLFAPAESRSDDLFAAKVSRKDDLFAPDYSTTPAGDDRLFSGTRGGDLFDESTVAKSEVSPLPSTARARKESDLLPIEEPIESTPSAAEMHTVPGADALSIEESMESTIAAENPLFADARLEAPILSDEIDTGTDGTEVGRAAEDAKLAAARHEHATVELPAWGAERAPEVSHPPFGQTRGKGSFEEMPPLPPPLRGEDILAMSAQLPEAPAVLEDPSQIIRAPIQSQAEPVGYHQFAETLSILRARIADAGLPDPSRILDAIDLLRKHPSVRAALTEPHGE